MEGNLRIDGVPPGPYRITAECQGYERLEMPDNLSVDEGQHVTGVAVKLVPYGVISSKVTDREGEPLAKVQVALRMIGYYEGWQRVNSARDTLTNDRGV